MKPGRVASVGCLVAAALDLAGCWYASPSLERTVGAERRRGPWVPPSGYEHFVRAELAAERGQLREAIGEYELARSGVIDGYLLSREAEAAARLPDVALAERLIDEGLMSDPGSEPLLLLRGRLAAERGDLAAAETALRHAHDGAPESAQPVLALAELLASSERSEDALALLDGFVASRPLDVPALRALLIRAGVAGDVRRASLAALRLVRASPVHRAEVLVAAERALEADHAAVAHAIFRALPYVDAELGLRFRAALAVHDRAECERLALRTDDGTSEGRLRAAERWIALGDGPRAEEIARTVLLERPTDARAQRIVAHGLFLQRRHARAAEVLVAMGSGTSEEAARQSLLREVLTAAGLPALARELGR